MSFIHTEKKHKHLHIILNRVNDDGSLLKDHFIGKRAQHIAHRIAKEMGLESAMEIKKQNQLQEKQLLKTLKTNIKLAHESISKLCPKNIDEYTRLMQDKGYSLKPSINKQGDVQGYRIDETSSGISLKLSEVDRKLKLNKEYFESLSFHKQEQKTELEPVPIRQESRKFGLNR